MNVLDKIARREVRGEKRDSYLRASKKHSNHDGLVRVFFYDFNPSSLEPRASSLDKWLGCFFMMNEVGRSGNNA